MGSKLQKNECCKANAVQCYNADMTKGLSTSEVKKQIEAGQINASSKRLTRTYAEIVRSNTLTYFNLMNLFLFIIVAATGAYENGLFMGTVLFNTAIGIIQEIKAKRVLDRLSILNASRVEAYRDSQWIEIKNDEIVKGDCIRLKNGMQVPADAEVLSGYLEVNESILTGESKAIVKNAGDVVLAGSLVTSGDAETAVIHVGRENYSETIMHEAKQYKRARSELAEELEKLLRIVSFLIIPVGLISYFYHLNMLDLSWQQSALKTVTSMVGMIPEGLVVLTSIALALSVIRLSRKDVLVQDLFSIESLARVDIMCLDKTGTLTAGCMQVSSVIPLSDYHREQIDRIMGSYARVFSQGNATDKAIHDYFHENDIFEDTDILPFSSDRKYAAASFKGNMTVYLGAASFLFPNDAVLAERIQRCTNASSRVLVAAVSDADRIERNGLPKDLKAATLIEIRDMLRPNAAEIMRYFLDQGVALKVISGDDPKTVSALAMQAGIPNADQYADMRNAREEDLDELLKTHAVFGRTMPEQKKMMVSILQKQGHTVAMIGDGVNDVPALKMADVGAAMASGSSAAKDSANVVLLNSDFAVMPDIVREGCRVINNICRASSMFLVKTVFSLLLFFYVLLFKTAYPFLPIHLTLISAFAVGIPTLLLQNEPSFERVQGSFLGKAFRSALPSAFMIFLMVMICTGLKSYFQETEYTFILISMTAMVYFYTLYKVYSPPTRMRIAIIIAMAVGFTGCLFFLSSLLQVSFAYASLPILAVGAIAIPFLHTCFMKLYDGIMKLFEKHNSKRS